MKNKLQKLKAEFLARLAEVKDAEGLGNLERQYLARKGELSELLRGLKDLSVELRKEVGALANSIKLE
jgi:phenylalanyl-tRNA synthetase alpha chain